MARTRGITSSGVPQELPPTPTSGRTLRDIVWEMIDEAVDACYAIDAERGVSEYARGLATMYATFINPYQPNVNAIRHEAVERWESRQ